MKFRNFLLGVFLSLFALPSFAQNPQQQNSSGTLTAADTACLAAQNDSGCVVLPLLSNAGGATISVQNIGSQTVNFEGTIDGTNYSALTMTNLSTGATATSTTSNGIWQANVSGMATIHARDSVYASGSATVVIKASVTSARAGGGSSSASSGGIASTPSIPSSGLLFDWQFASTDNPCAEPDSSGNGNASTGCTGTSPTIISPGGGVAFVGTGAITAPAALSTTVKTWAAYICWQNSGNGGGPFNILASDGYAGATFGAELQLFGAALTLPFASANQIFTKNYNTTNGGTYTSTSIVTPQGCFTVVWDYNTHDQIYINGMDTTPTNSSYGPTANIAYISQFTGSFHLGGVTGGYLGNATVRRLSGWNRVVTAAEAATITSSYSALATATGLPPFQGGTDNNSQYIHIGDSESTNISDLLVVTFSPSILGTPQVDNIANTGFVMSTQMVPFIPYECAAQYRAAASINLCNFYAGTNDTALTGAQIAGYVAKAAQQVHGLTGNGMKFLYTTGISRGTGGIGDTKMAALNTIITSSWQQMGLDGVINLGADPTLSPNGSNYTGACLSGDQTHPDTDCTYNREVPIFLQSVNHFLGNHDWGYANTYASASATTATTAGSESTNTITITTAATPANCQVNNMVTVAGTTPAGYSGNWLILTRGTSTITYYSRTTGLGAISVQGTMICPQQQDADESYIINFGTGNTTLEDCLGFLNDPRPVRIWNKNASSSTIVPFNSESLNGIASASTLAANTIAYLWPVQTSITAGGCSWTRTQ
jgi:hypothetical protein